MDWVTLLVTDSPLPFAPFPTYQEFLRGRVCQRLMGSNGIIRFLPLKHSPVEFRYIRVGITSTISPRVAATYFRFSDCMWSLSPLFLVEIRLGISLRSTPSSSSLLSILSTMDVEQSNPFHCKRTNSLSLVSLGVKSL